MSAHNGIRFKGVRVSARNLLINMDIHNQLRVYWHTVTRSNTANMTRIREDQVRGETPETKQLTLKIREAKLNILTLVVYCRNGQLLWNEWLCAEHNTVFIPRRIVREMQILPWDEAAFWRASLESPLLYHQSELQHVSATPIGIAAACARNKQWLLLNVHFFPYEKWSDWNRTTPTGDYGHVERDQSSEKKTTYIQEYLQFISFGA